MFVALNITVVLLLAVRIARWLR